MELTHINDQGRARMVDVSEKERLERLVRHKQRHERNIRSCQ
jgi:molybdenum cofactor biosynthesis enzyme